MITSAATIRAAEATARALLVDLPARRRHTAAVAARAQTLSASMSSEDQDALVAAAWLHDVGHAFRLRSTGLHALDGARYLEGTFPPRVVALVAHHSGARHEAALRGLSRDLDEYGKERSPVADLLTYCDLTTSPNGEQVDIATRLEDVERRYGTDHVVAQALNRARPEIARAVHRVEEELLVLTASQRSAAGPPSR